MQERQSLGTRRSNLLSLYQLKKPSIQRGAVMSSGSDNSFKKSTATADCNAGSPAQIATIIFADNQAAIKHAHSEGITARTNTPTFAYNTLAIFRKKAPLT